MDNINNINDIFYDIFYDNFYVIYYYILILNIYIYIIMGHIQSQQHHYHFYLGQHKLHVLLL